MEFFVFVSEQWLLVSGLLVLIYAYFITEKIKSGKGVSIHEVTRLVNSEGGVIVDLRETSEYKAGHIVDAISVPSAKLNDHMTIIEKHSDKTLILVDKVGAHSSSVGRTLRGKGFQVVRLEGGMSEWQNQNLPVVK